MMKKLRAWFIAGLLVWIPITVTIAVLGLLNTLVEKTLPARLRPQAWLGFPIPGLDVVLVLLLLLVTGMLAANFVGRGMVGAWEALMRRVPVVRSIYSASKTFAEVVFSDSNQSFKKVLLIEFPRKGLYSLAFQTSTRLGEAQARTGEEVVCTFVPTTPNPTSGFIVLVPKKEIIELDMAVDEALKMLFSLGVVIPPWSGAEATQLPLEMPPGAMPPRPDDS